MLLIEDFYGTVLHSISLELNPAVCRLAVSFGCTPSHLSPSRAPTSMVYASPFMELVVLAAIL